MCVCVFEALAGGGEVGVGIDAVLQCPPTPVAILRRGSIHGDH